MNDTNTAISRNRNPDRLRPLDGLRALRRLVADPADTTQAFRFVDAIAGGTRRRLLRRFRADPRGQKLLRGAPSLFAAVTDCEALRALPEGSLGRVYLDFVLAEGISAEALGQSARASGIYDGLDPERRWFAERLRDQHDLLHVVTGYRSDLVGEAGVAAFTLIQARSPFLLVALGVAWLRTGRDGRRVILEALRTGLRADWVLVEDWEAALARPLEEVRARLGVQAAESYTEIRSQAALPLRA